MALYQFDVLDSTNEYMKENRKKFQDYDIVLAKNQTAGKGRRGNIWISTEGMGLFTFLVRKQEREENINYMKLPLLVGLAAIRAFQKIKKAEYQFKWTNDIYLQDKKLGGILVERRENDFLIGIGLNINNQIPLEIKHIAISLQELGEQEYSIPDIVLEVVEQFRTLWKEYTLGNWKEILAEINEINYLYGKRVALRAGNLFVEGIVQQINDEGEIEIMSDGKIKSFAIGEVIRERLIFPLEANIESFAKAYILKEASYDVIICLVGEFNENWMEKLETLHLKVEKNISLKEAMKKYQAKSFLDFPNIFPLENYSEERIEKIAKMFV
ncbi:MULTISPECIES: biotin--[acetyl-CoA-carboxylase] ligase [Fusobacterium]|jgi:BirA family biotin operon repressor/biotin-[acetyl-CoA-carboxylase] ligase|uniref:biotin--[acetyl-CoA-carboxylase] ligase n=1 Tax=Fusobacterium TaxID=848 RepID=UPI0015A3C0F0|nr:biotin--[acetyl-CoA-carboxylase] ligase [Fusobacterium ulcerans]